MIFVEYPKYKVKSADRVLDILELFIGEKQAYTLTEVSKELGAPPSSTYVIIQNMLDRGFLERDVTGKKIMLGQKLNALRGPSLIEYDLSTEFHKVTERIFDDLNETISLGVRSGDQLIYIANRTSTHQLRFNLNAGNSYPIHSTASGKVLLSELTLEELRVIFPVDELKKVTINTIATFPELLEQLEQVRKEGISYNAGESVDGVHCVAAPIYNADRQMIAAISISVPKVRFTDEARKRINQYIRNASQELSGKNYN